jgi:hypothetical protein
MTAKPSPKELAEAVDLRLNRARSWLRKSRKAGSSVPPDHVHSSSSFGLPSMRFMGIDGDAIMPF